MNVDKSINPVISMHLENPTHRQQPPIRGHVRLAHDVREVPHNTVETPLPLFLFLI